MRTTAVLLCALLLAASRLAAQELSEEQLLRDIEGIPTVKMRRGGPSASYPRIKAVQIFVLPATLDEARTLFARWRQQGVNTIILRVFQNSDDRYHYGRERKQKDGVYFSCGNLPLVTDALGEVLPIAREHGLKVFAWMTTRYATYGGTKLPRMTAWSFDKKRFVEAKGSDVLDPSVQQHLVDAFTDLARYPIDGILVQDDLVLRQNEGFTPYAMAAFAQEAGFRPDPSRLFVTNGGGKIAYTDDFWTWQRWKSRKIAELLGRIRSAVTSRNPDIRLAVNLMYEAVARPKGALAWLAQDIEALKPHADYFSLMAYHRQIRDELGLTADATRGFIADMASRCTEIVADEPQRFLFKLQTKDWSTGQVVSKDELLDIAGAAPALQRLSIAIAPFPPELPEDVMRSLFQPRELTLNR